MATYNAHRGPNVSEFIANLNTIPSAQEMAKQDNFNVDDDLAMFTNTQFFDFDLGQDADLNPPNFNFDGISRSEPASASTTTDTKPLDFNIGEFSFPDFNSFSHNNAFTPENVSAGQHNPSGVYPPSSAADSPTSGLISPQNGEKRKAEAIADAQAAGNFEEASRLAAEEDKRRRNTAASARFRIKKKQREQALEKSAKEMSDKVAALEGRINQLETENKWLKNLVMEKNDSKDDIAALWKKYSQDASDRKGDAHTTGVGTAKAKA